MKAKAWLGVDLGGTNCRLALVDHQGRIMAQDRFPTQAQRGPGPVMADMAQGLNQLAAAGREQDLEPGGVGVACPGVVEHRSGVVELSPNLPGWLQVPLAQELSQATGLAVMVGNDANLYALGEQAHGAGQGCQDLCCFTLGTGVGGGLILSGRLVVGPLASGGEVGHLLVEPQGRPCPCGAKGCLEAYASGTALKAMLAEALDQGQATSLTAGDDPKAMAQAARQGDRLAQRLWTQAGLYLGRAMAMVATLSGADLMIIGGGLAPAWDLMEAPARDELAQRLKIVEPSRVRLRQGQLGDQAALLGGAALARSTLGS